MQIWLDSLAYVRSQVGSRGIGSKDGLLWACYKVGGWPIGFSSLWRNAKPTESSPTRTACETAAQRARNCEMPACVLLSREFCTLSVDLSKESLNRVCKRCVCWVNVDVVAFSWVLNLYYTAKRIYTQHTCTLNCCCGWILVSHCLARTIILILSTTKRCPSLLRNYLP
jgi:hypothetical protein